MQRACGRKQRDRMPKCNSSTVSEKLFCDNVVEKKMLDSKITQKTVDMTIDEPSGSQEEVKAEWSKVGRVRSPGDDGDYKLDNAIRVREGRFTPTGVSREI